ncbi:MAG: CoA ester lyase, partial [Actinophytocola sp.]|nr:CoA ester lyase [Actinophytocola sp.]
MRAHRSWMFVPGNKQRFLDKAAGLDVDVVLSDPEDGVPPEAKPLARSQIAEAIRAAAIPAKQYVRVNDVGSRWFLDDLAAVCDPRLHGLCLPKVETPRQVAQAA